MKRASKHGWEYSANPATLNIYFGLLDNCLGQKAGSLSGADLK